MNVRLDVYLKHRDSNEFAAPAFFPLQTRFLTGGGDCKVNKEHDVSSRYLLKRALEVFYNISRNKKTAEPFNEESNLLYAQESLDTV